MPRLGYKKTKTGCMRCRQRRVKCDEKLPCTACARHGVPCSLIHGPNADLSLPPTSTGEIRRTTFRRVPPPVTSPMSAGSAGSVDSPSSQLATPGSGSLSQPPDAHKISWVTDLELMHHYDTVTSLTMPRANEVDSVWQTVVVQMSFKNDALLHQILAVSAFHLAFLHPDQRKKYSLLGSQHQGDAAQMLRTTLANITDEESPALFAAASLLVIGAFAAFATREDPHSDDSNGGSTSGIGSDDSDSDRPSPTLEDLIDIFMLSRGMNAVLNMFEPTIQKGPMSGMFRLEMARPALTGFLESVHAHLVILGQHVAAVAAGETGAAESEREVASVVDSAIQDFLSVIRRACETASSPVFRTSSLWPIYVTEEYIALLRARQPMALAVFTYFCAIMHHSGQTAWFMRGCGQAVCRNIEKDIPADWKNRISWPLHYIATLEVE